MEWVIPTSKDADGFEVLSDHVADDNNKKAREDECDDGIEFVDADWNKHGLITGGFDLSLQDVSVQEVVATWRNFFILYRSVSLYMLCDHTI